MFIESIQQLGSKYIFNEKFNKFYYMFILFTFTVVIGGLFLYEASCFDVLKYCIYQLFYIFLPGYQIFRWLGLKGDLPEKLIFSYGLGVVLQILLYIILFYSGYLSTLFFVGPVLSVAALISYFRRNGLNNQLLLTIGDVFPTQFWFIYAALVFITFWGLTLANPSPNLAGTASYPQDVLWMVGNAEALMRNIPPFDARLSGVVFNYHYFAAVYWAAMSYITGINLFDIVFKYYQIGNLLLICGSVYVLGKTVFNNIKKAVIFMWVYFFTACASLVRPILNGYGLFLNINFVHITNDPFGFELALPLFLLCSVLCLNQIASNRMHWGGVVASAAFIFACTGAKGPSGFMIVGALFAVIIIALITKRSSSLAIYTLVLSGVILLVYTVFIASIYPATDESIMTIYPGYTAMSIPGLHQFLHINQFNETIVRVLAIVLIPLHFILFLPFASVFFLAWLFRQLPQLFKMTNQDIFLIAMAIEGIFLTYLFEHSGSSQLYFIMLSIPFITACAMKWLFENYYGLNNILKASILCLFIIVSISSASMVLHQGAIGALNVTRVLSEKNKPGEHLPDWNCITSYEYEAMQWLNKNTDSKALIASNRWYYDQDKSSSRFFYFSTLSDRQVYLEGWDYTNPYVKNNLVPHKVEICNQLYYGIGFDKKLIMENENIDYLIVSKFIQKDLQCFDEQLEKVFDNRDIAIYSRG
jgi:hypothetical protein